MAKHLKKKLLDIRKIMIEQSKVNPKIAFNVISNLNWFRYESRIEKITKILPRGARILDVGCGWGHTTAMLRVLRPDLRVVGLDLGKLSTWKKLKRYGCKYVIGDVKALCFKDKEFDAVVSFGVMEHVNGDDKFLKEIFRVLRNDGHNFIFDLPNKYGFSEVVIGKTLKFINKRKFRCHKVRYTKEKINTLLAKHGFIDIEIENEFLIPAQANKVSKRLGDFFNKNYLLLNELDKFLIKTSLAVLSQTLSIQCRKV